MENVRVAGVGMIPFAKPGRSASYEKMGAEAARAALADGGLSYRDIGQAFVGYVYADSTAGQCALYEIGLTGIPIFNVNNNCATGSTALYLARQAIASGAAEVVLALGFEQMLPGALGMAFADRHGPLDRHSEAMAAIQADEPGAPLAARYFGGAGAEYQRKYGAETVTFARIAEKARRHAANNPFALFRDPLSVEQVLQSPHLYGPLTRYQACPPTCGAAAAVLVSAAYARRNGLMDAVEIAGQALTTDTQETFDAGSMMALVGYGMTERGARQVYESAGVGADEIGVVELHDCFTTNELISYEALGLVAEGGAEQFIRDGENTYGGRVVVNPSGGLLSKGHPLGATGLAQCFELVQQLRGRADKRQVEGARHALQHNLGLGGACVVTLYRAA